MFFSVSAERSTIHASLFCESRVGRVVNRIYGAHGLRVEGMEDMRPKVEQMEGW
ncbi:hypothetical protein L7F22_048031, partial [Adiantum nelumboides]|nr:hypothetical protein [Adiantum nelumboides]